MNVFKYTNYKEFVRAYIRSLPKGGRGEMRKLAEILQIHATMLSHTLSGKSQFSVEQGYLFCEYCKFNSLETEYFLTLIEHEKASHYKLRNFIEVKIKRLKEKSKELKNKLKEPNELSENEKATYYSSWIYSAVRILSTIDHFQSVNSLKQVLELPAEEFEKIIDFLVKAKLISVSEGRVTPSQLHTILPPDSPLVWQHHRNWRLKSFEKHGKKSKAECFFTAPVSISEKDVELIREKILDFMGEFSKINHDSKPERLACLNIDWFLIK